MRSLRGHLLVAGPALVDPNFRRTVVLLGEHGDEGAMGVVLNRVSSTLVDDAVPPVAALTGPDEPVYLGGPVQPQAVVVLADFADVEQAEVVVVDSVGFLPGEIEDVAGLGELRGVRVFAGYAGWGAGTARDRAVRRCLDRRPGPGHRRVHVDAGPPLERRASPPGRPTRDPGAAPRGSAGQLSGPPAVPGAARPRSGLLREAAVRFHMRGAAAH
ncbi:MAG: YqgE/AlgH family protein [Gaiella sp.]|nr:YqgE/AlgH family protein [Gaiella sp.]